VKVALTIAGSDPTGGAGIQMDLKVFHYFGVYGISAITALTAQNTEAVAAIAGVGQSFFEEQMQTLLGDIKPDAVKTGMLLSKDKIKTTAKIVRGFELGNLVIDPVILSSRGTPLLEHDALNTLRDELFPLARVITPNIHEASVLSGMSIINEGDMERAACELKKTGADFVIITGGHYKGSRGREKTWGRAGDGTLDLIFNGMDFIKISGNKRKGEYHGTGCAYSASLTALIAKGISVKESARKAREFVLGAISRSHNVGRGMNILHV
jgi:hydroxymethylpyrimidine/phosphomethylpyrimidine kinase